MATGDPLDIAFIELSIKTERMVEEAKKAMDQLERELTKGVDKAVTPAEKRIIGMGRVFTASLQSFISTLAQTGNPLAAVTSGFQTLNGAAQGAAASGNVMAGAIAGITGKLAGLITVLAVAAKGFQTVINFLRQTGEQGVQLAARVETLNTGLEVIAKNTGNQIGLVRQKIQELQATGITTQESIQSLMQFMSQRLPIDNIQKLARAGQDMAVAFGRNSTETFNRFVYAITTGNAEVLQLVGITRTANMMQEDFARSLNKTVAQLTQQEKRQAIINGILREATNYSGLYDKSLESLGKRIGSLPRYIEEATLAFGQTLLPILSASVDSAENFWKGLQKVFVQTTKIVDEGGKLRTVPVMLADGSYKLTEFGQRIYDIASGIEKTLNPSIESTGKLLRFVGDQVLAATKLLGPFIRIFTSVGEIFVNLTKVAELLGKTIFGDDKSIAGAFKALGALAAITAGSMAAAFSFVADVFDALNKLMKGETIPTLQQIIDKAQVAAMGVAAAMLGIETKPTRATSYAPRRNVNSPTSTGLPDPEVEAERIRKQKVKEDLGKGLADAIDAGKDAIREAGSRYQEALDRLDKQVAKAIERLGKNQEKALAKLQESYEKAKVKLQESLDKNLVKVEEQANQAREQENQRYRDEQIRREEDYLLQIRRMEEDYTMSLEDAVQARDAKTAIQLMRRRNVDRQRAKEDHDIDTRREDENHDDRLQEISDREQEIKDELQKQYEEQLKQLEDSLKEQRDSIQESYDEQRQDIMDSAQEQRDDMKEQYAKQQTDLDDANRKRLAAMVKQWADAGIIDEKGATALLKQLDEYYGEDGKIEDLIVDFIERNLRNQKIEIVLREADKPENEPPPTNPQPPPGGCRAGTRWNRALGECVPYTNKGTGGLLIADEPTSVIMGEQGRELGLFVPDNMRMGLSQVANVLAGGAGRTGGETLAYDILLRLQASGEISREMEDALLDKLAQVVEQVLRVSKHRVKGRIV